MFQLNKNIFNKDHSCICFHSYGAVQDLDHRRCGCWCLRAVHHHRCGRVRCEEAERHEKRSEIALAAARPLLNVCVEAPDWMRVIN